MLQKVVQFTDLVSQTFLLKSVVNFVTESFMVGLYFFILQLSDSVFEGGDLVNQTVNCGDLVSSLAECCHLADQLIDLWNVG